MKNYGNGKFGDDLVELQCHSGNWKKEGCLKNPPEIKPVINVLFNHSLISQLSGLHNTGPKYP